MKIFKDNLNKAVFTTKFVMLYDSPIVYVVHDEDGDWQFFGAEDNLEDEDTMIVSLGQIIEHDPTVLEIADLPAGEEAVRDHIESPWKIQE